MIKYSFCDLERGSACWQQVAPQPRSSVEAGNHGSQSRLQGSAQQPQLLYCLEARTSSRRRAAASTSYRPRNPGKGTVTGKSRAAEPEFTLWRKRAGTPVGQDWIRSLHFSQKSPPLTRGGGMKGTATGSTRTPVPGRRPSGCLWAGKG